MELLEYLELDCQPKGKGWGYELSWKSQSSSPEESE
ncbi:Uncharacterised protein [Pseudomonas aeruginosa]|nr:Uncharacterised protein [Pseudomonas aeruginosa]